MLRMRKANSRTGSVLIGTVLGMVFMLGMLALVTDMGWLYYQKARIEGAVSAAWRAGMDEIIMLKNAGQSVDTTKVNARILDVFTMNGYKASDLATPIIASGGRSLRVYGKAPQPLFFSRVFRGMTSMDVDALRDGTGGEGMIPLSLVPGEVKYGKKFTGLDARGNPVYETGYWYNDFTADDFANDAGYVVGEEYILKLGPQKQDDPAAPLIATGSGFDTLITGGGNSNEGSLDLGGQGAANWLENMLYGYAGSLDVGDYVNTAQGEVTAKTVEGREYRATLGDIVTVPIIKVVDDETLLYNTGGSKTLVIVGFARVVISSIEEQTYNTDLGEYTTTQIRGKFVDYLVKPTGETLALNMTGA